MIHYQNKERRTGLRFIRREVIWYIVKNFTMVEYKTVAIDLYPIVQVTIIVIDVAIQELNIINSSDIYRASSNTRVHHFYAYAVKA